jgi:predicted Zn-dependent protease
VRVNRARESGLAVRAIRAGHDAAGFAASSGLSADALRWATDSACSYRALASAVVPGPAHPVENARWDLDDPAPLPAEDALSESLIARSEVQWVEAGTTVEVLVGADGWVAGRRRHRLWARSGGPDGELFAQRGFAQWDEHLDGTVKRATAARTAGVGSEGIILSPSAAAPVVSALTAKFHRAHARVWERCGGGWELADQPVHPMGLAGGEFDDSGFQTATRALAKKGVWVANLGGPGTFRRGSFREPPIESPTNLVVPGNPAQSLSSHPAEWATRCRVLRVSRDLWVLELGFTGGPGGRPSRWVRVNPIALFEGCAARIGPSQSTSEGPIVPGLVFEGF